MAAPEKTWKVEKKPKQRKTNKTKSENVEIDEKVSFFRESWKSKTYTAPAVRQKALMFRPRFGIDVEQAGGHNEHPRSQVDGVQGVIKNNWFAGSHRQYAGHDERYAKGYEVRWFACWNGK